MPIRIPKANRTLLLGCLVLQFATSAFALNGKARTMTMDQALDAMTTNFPVSLSEIEPKPDTMVVIERIGQRLRVEKAIDRRITLVGRINTYNPGWRWIRDSRIVGAIWEAGAAGMDDAFDEAIELLDSKGTVKALAPYHKEILTLLKLRPTPAAFGLIARAKPHGASAALEALVAADAKWKGDGDWKVAMAANGDHALESAAIQDFVKATDPQEKQRLARMLGTIGTRDALNALARELRTPLVYRLGRVFQEPVWIDIAKAIEANFPDQNLPVGPNSPEEYLKYESFCEHEFGIRWKTPRPPFESSGPLENGFSPVPESRP